MHINVTTACDQSVFEMDKALTATKTHFVQSALEPAPLPLKGKNIIIEWTRGDSQSFSNNNSCHCHSFLRFKRPANQHKRPLPIPLPPLHLIQAVSRD